MKKERPRISVAGLDSGDQVQRRGETLSVCIWYPPRKGEVGYGDDNARFIEVQLIDVRAADSIRIHYDFERDGYAIEQASTFEWDMDAEVHDPDWQEVAFIEAWAREKEEAPK